MNLLGSSHPGLTEIASYYFLHPSKQLRPLLVLLWSQAANGLGHDWRLKSWAAECEKAGGRGDELDRPLTRPDVLNDWNPNMPDHTSSFESVFALRSPRPTSIPPIPSPELLSPVEPRQVASTLSILPTQMRLAQIVEMIHVASLLHDDVIDESTLRRGAPSAPMAFGNKYSILGGDFLLGRASAALSRLDSMEVVELISSVIANLVEGEILQMKAVHGRDESDQVRPALGKENWNIYLRKTYLKTASLMAKGARAAVVLGGCREGEIWKEVAYAYGRNLGIAFQVNPRAFYLFSFNLNRFSFPPARGRYNGLRIRRKHDGQAWGCRSATRSCDGSRSVCVGGTSRTRPAHRAQVQATRRRGTGSSILHHLSDCELTSESFRLGITSDVPLA